MTATPGVFEIIFDDKTLPVKELTIAGRIMFLIPMSDGKPLMITKAASAEGELFWTSVPEGRQALAISIGKLIDVHFRKTF